MLASKQGCHWKEVEYTIQNIMDTYCGNVRTEQMLQRGLERLNDIKDIPLRAANAHELSRCLEVKSLMDNAEMVIRASLARKESRDHPVKFSRADYPEQDDKNWLAFSTIRLEKNEFKVSKIPLK
jgi:succinate dehydrogenase/fumarate reductase flavoprotein subunit